MNKNYLLKKKKQIEDVGQCIVDCEDISWISKVEYKIYYNKVDEERYYEFLLITFNGGSISPKCCTGNSITATLRVMGQMLDGGYYDEVELYNSIYTNQDYEELI